MFATVDKYFSMDVESSTGSDHDEEPGCSFWTDIQTDPTVVHVITSIFKSDTEEGATILIFLRCLF